MALDHTLRLLHTLLGVKAMSRNRKGRPKGNPKVKQKLGTRRSVTAASLAEPQYRQKKIPSKRIYSRKGRYG